MKKIIFGLAVLLSSLLGAQNTISGTFSPAHEYSWLIAYRLKPGTQVYVADTAIKNGAFTLNLKANAPAGTYRLVYAVPQEEFFFDVIYNGKENIELSFSADNGVSFTHSEENILFTSYFNKMNALERKIISFYSSGTTNEAAFNTILKKMKATQTSYEHKSKGLLSGEFIKANRLYTPKGYVPIQDFVANKKKHYFTGLDFGNPTLQASGFLTDKVVNYVFTALPLEPMEQKATEKEMQKNVRKVDYFTQSVSSAYKLHLYYNLWSQAAASAYNSLSDFIFANYLKALAQEEGKQEIIDAIQLHNRLRIGAIAPEITWGEKENKKSISSLEGYTNYVLVFWSSTCSHCLKELPALQKGLKNYPATKVIAIGIEEDAVHWNTEIKNLPDFEHAIGLGKWQGAYAKLYAINQTPSYFVLDKDKRFIAKPEDYKATIKQISSY